MTALLCLGLLLAGCARSVEPPPGGIPDIPPDIRACFRGVVDVPDRDLTVAEVERLWKQDRVRAAASARCGARLIAWVDALRAGWR